MTTFGRFSTFGSEANRREVTRVVVITGSGTFEGDFSYPSGDRLSDAIRAAETYIVLTNVSIHLPIDIEQAARNAPYLLINSAHIDVIVPLDHSEQQRVQEIA